MTTETPPDDWVLLEAAERFTWLTGDAETLRLIYTSPEDPQDRGFRALCDMIQQHGRPPEDRKVLCAREAIAEWVRMDGRDEEWIAIRAIELYEEGFGK
jgi:hypothetical protein